MPRRKRCTPEWRQVEYGKSLRRSPGVYQPLYQSTGWVATLPDGAVDGEPPYPGQKIAPFLCRVVRTNEYLYILYILYMLTTRARAAGGTRHRFFGTPEQAMEAGTQWVRRRFYHAEYDEAHAA